MTTLSMCSVADGFKTSLQLMKTFWTSPFLVMKYGSIYWGIWTPKTALCGWQLIHIQFRRCHCTIKRLVNGVWYEVE